MVTEGFSALKTKNLWLALRFESGVLDVTMDKGLIYFRGVAKTGHFSVLKEVSTFQMSVLAPVSKGRGYAGILAVPFQTAALMEEVDPDFKSE